MLADLAAIRAFDARQETILKRWAIVGGVGVLGAILALVWLFAARPERHDAAPVILFLGSLGLMLLAAIIWNLLKKRNLENRRYEIAERVLRFLQRDTARDAEVALKIDFTRPNTKAKFVRKGTAGHWKVKYFADPWLRVQGRLLDGTLCRLGVVEKRQDRSRWATSRSGKSKLKTKTKSATELIVNLKVKTRRYPGLPALAKAKSQLPQAVKLPEWARLKSVRIQVPEKSERALLHLSTATTQDWTCGPASQPEGHASGVRWFAMSILSLYQLLNRARTAEGV